MEAKENSTSGSPPEEEVAEESQPKEEVTEESPSEDEVPKEPPSEDEVIEEVPSEEEVIEEVPSEEEVSAVPPPEEEVIDEWVDDHNAAVLSAKAGVETAINNMLKDALTQKHFDAVLIPFKVPAGDSFVYLLIYEPDHLDQASPLAPIMPTQGGKALSNITRLGTGGLKIGAVMRPCETRAAIELSKLAQCDLDDVTLISFDCPGVLPTSVFNENPDKGIELFNKGMKDGNDEAMRPVCQIDAHSNSAFGDIHIGRLGVDKGKVLVIPKSLKGNAILDALGMTADASIDDRQSKVDEIAETRRTKRKQVNEDLKNEKLGLDNLMDTFSHCVKCYNCMRVCPVDYCQQCYFESDDIKYPPEDYFQRAGNTGSLRFPPDSLHYHLGRMIHMTMSCVSCGTCEDACPMSIPVAQVYSSVADDVQGLFDYLSGRDPDEPRPLVTYSPEEFTELED